MNYRLLLLGILLVGLLVGTVSATTLIVNSTSDGIVTRTLNNDTWSDIIGGAGTAATSSGTSQIVSTYAGTQSNTYLQNDRAKFIFNTSTVGSGSTINSVTFSVYGGGNIWSGLSSHSEIVLINCTNTGTVVASDYQTKGTVLLSDTNITWVGWNTMGWNNYTFNVDGENKINKTGLTEFMFVTGWDAGNGTPPYTAGLANDYIDFFTHTASYSPTLTVDYTTADTTPPASITSLTNTTTCSSINWSWINPADGDYDHLYVLNNGIAFHNKTSTQTYDLWQDLVPNVSYTFSSKTSDTSGNDNATFVNSTITTPLCTPVANFYADVTSGASPLTVQFTDNTTPANLIFYSEYPVNVWGDGSQGFNHTLWDVPPYLTYYLDNITAPDGTKTADVFLETTDNTMHQQASNCNETILNGTITASAYIKPINSQRYVALSITNYTNQIQDAGGYIDFQPSTPTFTSYGATSSTLNPVGNGWYRVSFTTPNYKFAGIQIYTLSPAGNSVHVGDVSKGFSVWGVQVEINNSVSPYIKSTDTIPANPATSWSWKYSKDGGTWTVFSNSQNPTGSFINAGVYSINLTVTNPTGSTDDELRIDYITATGGAVPTPTTVGGTGWSLTGITAAIVGALALIGVMLIGGGTLMIVNMFRSGTMGRGDSVATSPSGMGLGIAAITVGALLLVMAYIVINPLFILAGA